MKKVFFTYLIIFCFGSSQAQFMDSIQVALNGKRSVDARLESRYGFFKNGLIAVNGVRLGVTYQRKLRLGAGLSWLKTDVPESYFLIGADGEALKRFSAQNLFTCACTPILCFIKPNAGN